jgi:hypothetical protein
LKNGALEARDRVGFNDVAKGRKLVLCREFGQGVWALARADKQTVGSRNAIAAKGECFFITE